MGTYSYSDYLDTFGGPPEPGETYPDDPDALRDALDMRDEPISATEALRDGFGEDQR